MNENARPEGYLQQPTPAAGMRPFVARRPAARTHNPNRTLPIPVVGEVIPLPAGWCYRCFQPGHIDAYRCWPELRPVTPKRAAQQLAIAVRTMAGVPLALASWSAADEIAILDLAAELVKAADAATDARIRRGERELWEGLRLQPVRPDVGTPVERFGQAGVVVEAPADWRADLVPVVFDGEPSIVTGYPMDEWSDLVPLETVE